MKVFFDVTSLAPKELSPDGIYTLNLFRLLRGLGTDVEPVYKPLRGFGAHYIEEHISSTPKKLYSFFAAKNSILHGPSGNLLSESPKFRRVLSINDMSMFREGLVDPKHVNQYQSHMKEQMQTSPLAIIVPTYEVHNEFLVRFPQYVNKVHVIQPGSDHFFDASGGHDAKVGETPYFFFNGVIDKKSNLSGVVKAFNAFCSIQPEIRLLIAGVDGYGSEAIHKMINSCANKNRIQVLGYRTGAQLKKIYTGAIATLAPSIYDGFNFSIVEAMKMGCPVLTSAVGSMQEIGRDGAHLVNPKDPEQIMAGMERLLVDKNYVSKLVEAGKEITQKMTWLNCAREVAQVYSHIG